MRQQWHANLCIFNLSITLICLFRAFLCKEVKGQQQSSGCRLVVIQFKGICCRELGVGSADDTLYIEMTSGLRSATM